MQEVKVIGSLESKFESTNRIYDVGGGCSPTLSTMQGGNQEPKILEAKQLGFMDNGTGKHQSNTVYDENALCHNITTVEGGGTQQIKILESQVLAPKRTEYGKAIRKDYESGKVRESRHNMTELEPRTDGISNTLTTVQKDNMVLIKQATKNGSIECEVGGCFDASYPESQTRRGRVQDNGNTCPTLTAQNQDIVRIDPNYRIRKLTPRECGRLMGVSDEDISKMELVNSNTQLYKQFGNSIVVDVMCEMFKNLNIDQ